MSCPSCKSKRRILLHQSTLWKSSKVANQYLCTSDCYGIHGPIYKCLGCNFIFVIDNTRIMEIVNCYKEVEDPLYLAEHMGREKTFSRHLKIINRLFQHKGKLLDVGSYTGVFLSLAKLSGWKVKGIEPSQWAVKAAQKNYNLSLVNGILKRGYFPNNTFEVVTMWDVIEHFTDPKDAIKIAFSYLKPGGALAMSTVDVGSFIARFQGSKWPWFMRMHRVYFSKDTMRTMLQDSGFENIVFLPHIRSISLRYLATRLKNYNKRLSRFLSLTIRRMRLENIIIPFYVGDIFDVYAYKKKN